MSSFANEDQFVNRHIGVTPEEKQEMLDIIGLENLDQLIDQTIPAAIRQKKALDIPEAQSEYAFLKELKTTAQLNKVYKSYIGQGFYGTITPSVLLRNVFQNPGWYTQYTPYQAEISQGRLEALLNFQTMLSDLTALPIANASLLDEGTAAAEGMAMFHNIYNKKNKKNPSNTIFVDDNIFEHTFDVLQTRAEPLGITIKKASHNSYKADGSCFAILLQYPGANGAVENFKKLAEKAKKTGAYVIVVADLLSLTLLTPPGEWGADAVVGNSQRFGVPMGFGGPHAAFFTTKEDFKRQIPGRIIGMSIDSQNKPALRMALQTREQHIRREKATSNICTAQALLAIMAGMYAVYHGAKGLWGIANRTHLLCRTLEEQLKKLGYTQTNKNYFDSLAIELTKTELKKIKQLANKARINFFYTENGLQITVDETTSLEDVSKLVGLFAAAKGAKMPAKIKVANKHKITKNLQRTSDFLTHPVFNSYHSETKMMRYLKQLENKDLSLMHAMIPLGSCTMKLNAATQLFPVSWHEFANIHPFAPATQTKGYQKVFEELEQYLCEITGFAACSLQPNSGAQGEYAGLLTIRAYHKSCNETHRNIALIPSSAHGTNPASAVMAGMKVIVVATDEKGNINVEDLKNKAEEHQENLSCLMVTYPSTHGVFETSIKDICKIIHKNGGKVYMDGANMNAQVGLTSPGAILADVCHLNLHKTFSIPHGGGGPGMGPICVNESLAPFLPGHSYRKTGGKQAIPAVSSAPWGSASILLISYAYIRLLGREGVTNATKYAILNANYIKAKLAGAYEILYTGESGCVAHELIVDLRPFKVFVSAEDVAKRLVDYGFHAPTLSFPVAGTVMIEPTESESKEELDLFCDAMLSIKKEIDAIARGEVQQDVNVLCNAPHTLEQLTATEWNFPYSREEAAWPLPYLRTGHKFWPAVSRVNNGHGDRNLICTCPPLENYMEEEVE